MMFIYSKIRLFVFLFCLVVAGNVRSQTLFPSSSEHIKTVYLTLNGVQLYIPTIYLEQQQRVRLHFDYLGDMYIHSLYAEIKICDEYWRPTDDPSSYYLRGSSRISLNSFQNSTAMNSEYAHIDIAPFENAQIIRSGNYIFCIYTTQSDTPLYTQPLIISEHNTSLSLTNTNNYFNFDQTASVQLNAQFSLEENTSILNPVKNLQLFLLQNTDWNTWHKAPAVPMSQGKGFSFGDLGEIQMSKYSSFRYIETDNFNMRGMRTSATTMLGNRFYVIVSLDMPQIAPIQHSYSSYPGYSTPLFGIASLDRNTYADYAQFSFAYKSVELATPVYIVGQFNQFRLDSSSLMRFNRLTSQYESVQYLKQGHHQYIYVSKTSDGYLPPLLNSADQTTQHALGVVYYFNEQMKAPRVLSVGEIYF